MSSIASRGRAARRRPSPDRRIRVLMLLICGLLAAVFARALQLQTLDHAALAARGRSEHRERVTLYARRGDIVDRTGQPLAVSEQAVTIGAYVPVRAEDLDLVARAVASTTGLDEAVVRTRLRGPRPAHIDLIRQADPAVAARLQTWARRHWPAPAGPLTFIGEEKRVYPAGIGTQLVGTTSVDHRGLAGLEARYDARLRGRDGAETVVRGAGGEVLSALTARAANDGERLELTLDRDVQNAAESVAARTVATTGGRSATAIVLDPRTGGVLAMASSPGVGDSPYGQASSDQQRIRAIADQYEPGSTFKPLAVGAALERGAITPSTRILVPSELHLYDRVIRDAHPHGDEVMTVADILKFSSNIGTVEITSKYLSGPGPADHGQFYAPWIGRAGFGQPTGIDLPGEATGAVPPYREWSGVSIGNIPFGQGLSVSPLQLADYYAAIANRGTMIEPHLAARFGDGPLLPLRRHLLYTPQTARDLTTMLARVVSENGTGSKAIVPGYTVAGKTGTTQKVIDGKYSDTHFIGWFVGFAPVSRPRVVTLVTVDDPKNGYDGTKGDYFGGSTAAPAFAELTARTLRFLGVPRDAPMPPRP